ncbi:hypothetical protein F5984_13090 [Rudanella paleaurantiibacter]|uniref:Uncharacterized protein n=1 Tax=Rudanella paleaurantiibacter TaxID=2614655 RepID=A0A7J5TYA4_9BACT|nr:hypothetical protein [Rudanella paleaurantiibacter]KAB7730112.1 hypothetical protein F5984_13090 [Rudanella paleaurantiibacter]
MLKELLILFLVFGIIDASVAQDPAYPDPNQSRERVRPAGDSEPFKGANTITLISGADNLFTTVGQILTEEGYTVKADREFGSIVTDERSAPNNPQHGMVIKAFVKNNTIRMSATIQPHMSFSYAGVTTSGTPIPAEYRNTNMTVHRIVFLELDRVARLIADAVAAQKLTYSVR